MHVRRVAALAILAVTTAGATAPALAATKKPKPVTKSYDMQLLPVPDPPQGSPSCDRAELEGISIHSETLKTKGPGTLSVKVNGFYGDWDISVFSGDHELEGVGDGSSTPNTSSSTGEDTYVQKFKKPVTLQISICNFAGTPQAHGSYTFTYK